MAKYIVWGYWEKNLGDDLFLLSFLGSGVAKNKQNVFIATRSSYFKYYKSLGISVFKTDSLINRIFRKIFSIDLFFRKAKNNVFICLGGSLFKENKSLETENKQLMNLEYAVKKSKQSFVIGSNFGPYHTSAFLESYYKVFSKMKAVSFRDKKSINLFKCDNMHFYPDVVLSGLWETLPFKKSISKTISISVIDLANRKDLSVYKESYENMIVSITNWHTNQGDRVSFLSFCEKEGDLDCCQRLFEKVNDKKSVEIVKYDSLNTIIGVIKDSKKVYGTRFHSIILSIYFGVGFVPFVYDEKTLNALESYCSTFDYVRIPEIGCCDLGNLLRMENKSPNHFKKEASKHFELLTE